MIKHGIYSTELETALSAPKKSESAVICAVVTAPVGMLDDPAAAVNTPILVNSAAEGMAALGYSTDMSFSSNQLLYLLANVNPVAPVIVINVADPGNSKHTTAFDAITADVADLQARAEVKGAIKGTVSVTAGETVLEAGTDYVVSYDNDGYLLIDLAPLGAGAEAATVTVSGKRLDPSKVTDSDAIGGYNVSTGATTGIEVMQQVYPKLGIVPTILVAPGFSQNAEVGIALAAKAKSLNGLFKGIAYVDIDSDTCRKYTDVKEQKESQGATMELIVPMWPQAKVGKHQFPMSIVQACATAALDSDNGDVPYASPSNQNIGITGTCLADGTPVYLDVSQANTVNSFGVSTAINFNGWRSWGNYTGAYPASGDPKDFWICTRRMMNWYENSLIINYFAKVDSPMNKRLLENFLDSERIRMNAYVAADQVAGFSMEYNTDSNPTTDIIAGTLNFDVSLAFFTPAQDINWRIAFDTAMLAAALGGAAA